MAQGNGFNRAFFLLKKRVELKNDIITVGRARERGRPLYRPDRSSLGDPQKRPEALKLHGPLLLGDLRFKDGGRLPPTLMILSGIDQLEKKICGSRRSLFLRLLRKAPNGESEQEQQEQSF